MNGLSASFTNTLLPSISRMVNLPVAFIQPEGRAGPEQRRCRSSPPTELSGKHANSRLSLSLLHGTLTEPAFEARHGNTAKVFTRHEPLIARSDHSASVTGPISLPCGVVRRYLYFDCGFAGLRATTSRRNDLDSASVAPAGALFSTVIGGLGVAFFLYTME